jgi:peptide/nickel transport system substrate-binding protein
MGTVYLAYDPKLERQVAVKLLPTYFAQDPEFSARFAREARTVAGLDHHAIVAIHDYGEDGVWPYFVMRYMRGGSLKDRIAQGQMSLDQAILILRRVAGALDKAHEKGVIHRDLKPANILFDGEGQSYLSDFGIVKLAESSENFTQTGNTLGTPAYMSPEQVDSLPDIDGRSDIYSLGVVLYEMLAGQRPFEHDSNARLMLMHLTEPIPDIAAARPDLPPGLQAVMDKAMAKERTERYATAKEMIAALQQLARAPVRPAVPPPPARPAETEAEAAPEAAAADQPVTPTPRQDPIVPAQQAPAKSSSFPKWILLVGGLFAAAIFVVFAGVIFAVFGSGGDPTPTAGAMGPGSTEEPVIEPTSEATDEPVDGPTEEPAGTSEISAVAGPTGSLRLAAEPLAEWDPALIFTASDLLLAGHIYDYLIDIDDQSNFLPRLATGWQVSEDGTSYTFSLAEGVTWHDGDPFTAEDVVWTFERLLDPDTGSPAAGRLSQVEGVEASGELEVTFTLDQPSPFFLFDLAGSQAFIVKRGSEDYSDFNGTGPFIVNTYRPAERMSLRANPDYFIAGQPKLASIDAIFLSGDDAVVEALLEGSVDLAVGLPLESVERLRGEAGLTIDDTPSNGLDLIRLRTDQPPGDDPRVLWALKYATDRRQILEGVYFGQGTIGNDTPIAPSYGAYYEPDAVPPDYDPERASALLDEAGIFDENGDGYRLDLVLYTLEEGRLPALAETLQEMWSDVGINLDVEIQSNSEYWDGWRDNTLGITPWYTGRPVSPAEYLELMLACDASWNETRYCSDEFEELLAAAKSEMDPDRNAALIRQIQQVLVDEGPLLIPYFHSQYAVLKDDFTGLHLSPYVGRSDLRDLRLAE